MNKTDEKNDITNNSHNESNNSDAKNSINGLIQNYELSNTDEESLLKLMLECDFASSNAENFIEKLQNLYKH